MCNGCKRLSSIVLSRKITEIEGHAFAKCSSLKSIKIPISCNSIGHSAFMNCTSLSDVRIPINCQKIGDYAFQGCSSLNETFFIPLSVRSIGECAFISTPIKKIYYPFGVSIEKIGLSHDIVNFQVYMDIPDEFAVLPLGRQVDLPAGAGAVHDGAALHLAWQLDGVEDRMGRDGFAAAALPDDAEGLAGAQGQVHMVDGAQQAFVQLEGRLQVPHFEDVFSIHARFPPFRHL